MQKRYHIKIGISLIVLTLLITTSIPSTPLQETKTDISYDETTIEFPLSAQNLPLDAQSTTGPTPPEDCPMGSRSSPIGDSTIISDVPSYTWYNGCGPTAAGMVIGYWDGQGFDELVPGDASSQTAAVNSMISSSGNYDDYCVPIDSPPNLLPDKSELPVGDEHDDNCVADFMKTSQSYHNNYYGWSWFSDVAPSLTGYVNWAAPYYEISVNTLTWGGLTWENYCEEIDANHPVVFLVDIDGDGGTDHFITAIGYDDDHNYACYNTWDHGTYWYDFSEIDWGNPWGIYGAIFCTIIEWQPGPILSFEPSSYDFGEMLPDETDSTTFEIWNNGIETLDYFFSETCSWVDISPMSGSSIGEHDTITIDITTDGLGLGPHTCDISISSNGGNGIFRYG